MPVQSGPSLAGRLYHLIKAMWLSNYLVFFRILQQNVELCKDLDLFTYNIGSCELEMHQVIKSSWECTDINDCVCQS